MFSVNHALSCKKGGFIAQRHDTIRDLLISHISKVCRNVETEPLLQPLDNEVFNLQSTFMSREARLDMKAGGFWTPRVTAFFDVRVTHVNSRSNQGKHTATIFKEQENEKKRKYNQRVMDVEMGTLIPLVFGTNGGMGLDCQNVLRTLSSTLSSKNKEPNASVISWLRIQLSFAVFRTFALIVTTHPYCARKFECYVMHRARAPSTKMNNDKAGGHCYDFAWILRSWTFGDPYFSFQKQILFTIISLFSKNKQKVMVGS